MFFDVLVVLRYLTLLTLETNGSDIDKGVNDTIEARMPNETFSHENDLSKSCQINTSEALMKIPNGLETLPQFNYSLSFIIIPWIFYLIEFLLSRYLKEAVSEVNTFQINK